MGDNPNYAEDNKGEYGHGNSHQLLLDLCHSSGIEFDEIYYTPAVKCRKGDKAKVTATQLKHCKEYLFEELERIKPEYVITLGATALKALTNKAKITEIHGKVIDHKLGFKVLPTFHPSMSMRDPRFWDRIHVDFRKFGKVVNGEELPQHKLEWEWITLRTQLKDVLSHLKRSRVVAFDLETNGLQMRYRTSEIGQTVLATFRMVYVIEHECFTKDQMEKFHKEVDKVLQGKVVVGQNAKFDNLWLWYMFGVRFPLTFDTMLSSHLLDENAPNGLKQNARSKLQMEDWDIDLKVKKGQDLTEEQKYRRAEYAAWDGYATIRLYKVDKEQLAKDPDLERLFHSLVMPVARVYEQVEINGVHVDLEQMEKARVVLERKLRRLNRTLERYIKGEVNWNSAADVNRVLFKELELTPEGYTPKGEPSTAEDYLVKMKSQHRIIEPLLAYRGAFKQLSSFIRGWAKRMIDGKLYPSFKVAGTVTGRPSCSDPNLQQVPRDPFIRDLIGAPESYVFFEVDYSQIELRVAAAIANERNMLQIFRTGGDIHEATYQMVMGISTAEAVAHIDDEKERKAALKEERKKAKAINFGFIYGMGWKKFREYAEAKYGLKVTDAEARAMRKRYFETYPDLLAWHDRQRRIVHAMGEVRTYTGRIRHLPQVNSPDRGLMAEAERNAINAPVQGFGAEMILMAMVEVNEYFQNDLLKLGGTVHDAMVGIVREDVALECLSRVKKIMESPRIMNELGIKLPLPIIADVSVGNWGSGREISAEELPEPIKLEN